MLLNDPPQYGHVGPPFIVNQKDGNRHSTRDKVVVVVVIREKWEDCEVGFGTAQGRQLACFGYWFSDTEDKFGRQVENFERPPISGTSKQIESVINKLD